MQRAVFVLAAVSLPGVAVAGLDGAAAWTPTRLPSLCQGSARFECGTQARAISDGGLIVGSSDVGVDPDGKYRAVAWSGGRVRDLGTLGGAYSLAEDANDAGEIVGWSYVEPGVIHAFLWKRGRMRDLGALGGPFPARVQRQSAAHAINERGQIVGETRFGEGRQRAFLWEAGKMRLLRPLPGDTDSGATGINERGEVVGWSAPSPDVIGRSLHAVVWRNGLVRNLGIRTDYGGASINDLGHIVTSSGVLLKDGRTTDLCALAKRPSCSASALNNHGQIVGGYFDNLSHGLLWQGGRAYRFRFRDFSDINDQQKMVANAIEGHGIPDEGWLWTRER